MQETLHYDPARRRADASLRSKEEAHDYRYFPEPDLVPLEAPGAELIEALRGRLPELPAARIARFERELGLPRARYALDLNATPRDRRLLRGSVAAESATPRAAANWVLNQPATRLDSGAAPARHRRR